MTDSPTSHSRPGTVTASFVLWLITVLIGLVGGILLFVLASSSEVAGTTSTSAGIGATVFIIAGALTVVISVVQLLVVFKMRAGKNWARITLTVLAALQAAGALTNMASNPAGLIGLAAVIVATILMFVPASNTYFARR